MVSREELYELVWSMPMVKVAEKFNVSGSYMARICSILHVPRPERGYWAKLAVGKAPEKPPLPAAQPGDQLSWSQDGESPLPPPPRLAKPPSLPRRKLPRPVTGIHGLIRDAKGHYDAGYKVDEGQHLRPYKRLLVDVTASIAGLEKALAFANDLFNALESAGHRVIISSPTENFSRPRIDEHEQLPKAQRREPSYDYNHLWSPQRPTVVYVGSVAFGLAIIEMSESVAFRCVNGKYIREPDYKPSKAAARYGDHSWTTTKNIPCGRLRLVIYAPYRGVSWSTSFQESEARALTRDISKIVKSIENSTKVLVDRVKEAERQAELRHQEWQAHLEKMRQDEDRRRVAQSIKESREQLDQVIQEWARIISLEQFFEGVRNRAQELHEEQRQEVMKRLELARAFVGTQDPLDFFRSWRMPAERYVPLSMQTSETKRGEEED
jgi:Asp-tRNA(Asn)/Glu-tRNA(Gln) amidotransferase C subunit